MKVDDLMTMLGNCHHEAEVLLCINNQTYDLKKLASIVDTSLSYDATDDMLLITPAEAVQIDPTALKLCLGDLE